MDSYSIRFASGRISPNLDPQVVDCWLDTTGELHRARRPSRYNVVIDCRLAELIEQLSKSLEEKDLQQE